MKVAIIEDESLAAKRLEGKILRYNPDIEIVAVLPSIKSSVKWLSTNTHPDLLFMDIHLEDGQSFSIFEHVQVDTPIIFTTAFDEYTIKAFKLNSVDYLLKPINYEELTAALDKFSKYHSSGTAPFVQELKKLLSQPQETSYKSRFLITQGSRIRTIPIDEVAYFYSEEKVTFLVSTANQRFPVDFSLDKLYEVLDPKQFFRVNRQFIVKLDAIKGIEKYSPTRLKVSLQPTCDKEVFVSTEKYGSFKDWLDA